LKVSAIIPTYNRRGQIFRAIDSVLAQTVPANEILVVDDGSTDGTAEAVKQRYGSQVCLIRQANAGVSAARNRGIAESHGEWLGFLDSDDWWHPDKLRRQFATIELLGNTAGVCFTDNVYGGHPEMTFSRFEEVGFRKAAPVGVLDDIAWRILDGREPFFTSSFLIRRALLTEVGGFDETLTLREDTDVAFRLSFKTSFCFVDAELTEIDRTPSRSLGLCNLYGTRQDVVFACSERVFRGWLAMPEVIGSQYEAPVVELLRETYYAWAESRIHVMRLVPAIQNLVHVRKMGEGFGSILATLAARKMVKIKRNWAERFNRSRHKPAQSRVGVT
jgi:glycosyltransferase involved in cell wall biosynthesis